MLTYKAAQMVDDGRFRDETDAAYLNAAKLMSARTAVHATDHAMQAVGGHAYMEVPPAGAHVSRRATPEPIHGHERGAVSEVGARGAGRRAGVWAVGFTAVDGGTLAAAIQRLGLIATPVRGNSRQLLPSSP